MLEAAGALALVARLCGDEDTVCAVFEGDESARHQLQDAFSHLGAVGERFDALGPPPHRLTAVGAISRRALSAFSGASRDFTEGIERGIDVETMQRVRQQIRDGDAVLGELNERPELDAAPPDASTF